MNDALFDEPGENLISNAMGILLFNICDLMPQEKSGYLANIDGAGHSGAARGSSCPHPMGL